MRTAAACVSGCGRAWQKPVAADSGLVRQETVAKVFGHGLFPLL